jgi:hypothetical protein
MVGCIDFTLLILVKKKRELSKKYRVKFNETVKAYFRETATLYRSGRYQ